MVSLVPFVTAETETNLSEWKMWWPQDEHIGHIELAMLMHRQQQCAKEWPSLLGENGKGSDSRRRNPWDISAQKIFCFVSKCRNLFFCSQFCELIRTPWILERAVILEILKLCYLMCFMILVSNCWFWSSVCLFFVLRSLERRDLNLNETAWLNKDLKKKKEMLMLMFLAPLDLFLVMSPCSQISAAKCSYYW